MGRTLWGLDLDESPVGGLIESLLDEEDLAKLDADARPDGGTEPAGGDGGTEPDGDDGATTDSATADDGAATASESDASTVETGDPRTIPSLDAGADGGADDGGADDGGADDGGADDEEGRLAAIRSRLRLLALAIAGLAVFAAVLAVVAWRYGDRIKSALPSRLRRDGSDAVEVGADADADESPAWEPGIDVGEGADEGPADEETAAGETEPAEVDAEGESGAVETDEDTDLGALVALAFLALVATLVREFARRRDEDALFDGDGD